MSQDADDACTAADTIIEGFVLHSCRFRFKSISLDTHSMVDETKNLMIEAMGKTKVRSQIETYNYLYDKTIISKQLEN